MRIRLLWLLLALPMLMAAQTKKPSTTTVLDVDRLYAKYKNQETVTIQSSDGEITAYVKIELNDAGKPYAVILYGWGVKANETLLRLKESLVAAKKRAGYRYNGESRVSVVHTNSFGSNTSATADLYEKGSQYAKYGINSSYKDLLQLMQDKDKGDFFYFEVGDVRRRSTSKQESFTF